MLKIYHNPRCRKSREGLQILKDSGKEFRIVEYLKTPLNAGKLQNLLKQLNMSPLGLVRKNEIVWKENFKGKALSDEEIIQAMVTHPKLMERPIVTDGKKAVIGRPPENIHNIFVM